MTHTIHAGERLQIVRGDDYYDVDGQAIEFLDSRNEWPDLTSGSIIFTGRNSFRDSSITVTGSVIVPSGVGKTVRIEPTHAQTTGLKVGKNWSFDIQATLADGHIATIVLGVMEIIEDFSPPS